MRTRTRSALIAAGVALITVGSGAAWADATTTTPPAVTDKTCPFSLAQARTYTTRPSLVQSTKTASCVFKYVQSFNPTAGFTRSAAVTYTTWQDTEYHDPGGDGVYSTRTSGRYWTNTKAAAYEIEERYDGHAEFPSGTDQSTLRYLDKAGGTAYLDHPQAGTGWSKAPAADEAGSFVLNRSSLFEPSGLRITKWTKAASNGRNTWKFWLGGDVNGGTVSFVVASNGQLLKGRSSIHSDGTSFTTTKAFDGAYANVHQVYIPPQVVAAAK